MLQKYLTNSISPPLRACFLRSWRMANSLCNALSVISRLSGGRAVVSSMSVRWYVVRRHVFRRQQPLILRLGRIACDEITLFGRTFLLSDVRDVDSRQVLFRNVGPDLGNRVLAHSLPVAHV